MFVWHCVTAYDVSEIEFKMVSSFVIKKINSKLSLPAYHRQIQTRLDIITLHVLYQVGVYLLEKNS